MLNINGKKKHKVVLALTLRLKFLKENPLIWWRVPSLALQSSGLASADICGTVTVNVLPSVNPETVQKKRGRPRENGGSSCHSAGALLWLKLWFLF